LDCGIQGADGTVEDRPLISQVETAILNESRIS